MGLWEPVGALLISCVGLCVLTGRNHVEKCSVGVKDEEAGFKARENLRRDTESRL